MSNMKMQICFALVMLTTFPGFAAHPDPVTDGAVAAQVVDTTGAPNPADYTPLRRVVNPAYTAGERLEYVVRYGPVEAGTALLAIPEEVEYHGAKCYRIISEANTNAFFSTFHKVRDRIESLMDVEGLFSWKFEKHVREGRYKDDQVVLYDQVSNVAISKDDTMRVPEFVQDVLSAMYFLRTQEFNVGDSIFIDNHSDGKFYPLKIIVHKRERVRVRAGKFDCYMVEPVMRTAGLFQRKGRLLVWLTADRRKVPVLMKSKIIVGSIVAEMTKMSGVLK